jgi:hypothetical protein
MTAKAGLVLPRHAQYAGSRAPDLHHRKPVSISMHAQMQGLYNMHALPPCHRCIATIDYDAVQPCDCGH